MRFDRFERRERRVGLTPLIDVVFLLLIFFMLASQLGQARVLSVEVSDSDVASTATADATSTLRLSAAGELLVGKLRVPLGAPVETLRAALADSHDRLTLVADSRATVQQITLALVDLERAGASSVTLAEERASASSVTLAEERARVDPERASASSAAVRGER